MVGRLPEQQRGWILSRRSWSWWGLACRCGCHAGNDSLGKEHGLTPAAAQLPRAILICIGKELKTQQGDAHTHVLPTDL